MSTTVLGRNEGIDESHMLKVYEDFLKAYTPQSQGEEFRKAFDAILDELYRLRMAPHLDCTHPVVSVLFVEEKDGNRKTLIVEWRRKLMFLTLRKKTDFGTLLNRLNLPPGTPSELQGAIASLFLRPEEVSLNQAIEAGITPHQIVAFLKETHELEDHIEYLEGAQTQPHARA